MSNKIKNVPTVSEIAAVLANASPVPSTRAERRLAAREAIANILKGRVKE